MNKFLFLFLIIFMHALPKSDFAFAAGFDTCADTAPRIPMTVKNVSRNSDVVTIDWSDPNAFKTWGEQRITLYIEDDTGRPITGTWGDGNGHIDFGSRASEKKDYSIADLNIPDSSKNLVFHLIPDIEQCYVENRAATVLLSAPTPTPVASIGPDGKVVGTKSVGSPCDLNLQDQKDASAICGQGLMCRNAGQGLQCLGSVDKGREGSNCTDPSKNEECGAGLTCMANTDGLSATCIHLPGIDEFCYPNGKGGGSDFQHPPAAPGKCGSINGKPLACVPLSTVLPSPYGKTDFYVCKDQNEGQQPPCGVKTTTLPNLPGMDGRDISQRTITLENCGGVNTALGFVLNTNAPDAVKGLFAVILSIIGGVALVRIILAGLTIMTSAGNPDKIKEAREGLQSALIGLVFALLSMVILQTIGYDILHIPGIGK